MTICCDIDGTLIFSVLENGVYRVVDYNTELIKKINQAYADGETIILHTGRHWNHLQLTIKQLQDAGVKYDTLVCGKPVADIYIDDKAVAISDFLVK